MTTTQQSTPAELSAKIERKIARLESEIFEARAELRCTCESISDSYRRILAADIQNSYDEIARLEAIARQGATQ